MRDISGKKNPKYKHGMKDSVEYKTWCSMKGRCYNPNDKKYNRYGGRGIKVCDRWLNSFENFYEDMGNRPSGNYSIHRIDNDGDYCPDNCKWATQKEQANERCIAVKVTINDKTQNLKDWCRELKINYYTVLFRIHEMNMSPKEALIKPLSKNFRDYHTINGVTKCLKDWTKEYNIPYSTFRARVYKRGMSVDEALNTPIDVKYRTRSRES